MRRDSITHHLNDQSYVLQHLSTQPQGALNGAGSGNDMVLQRLGQTLARVSDTVPF